jgi:LysM repeat protein
VKVRVLKDTDPVDEIYRNITKREGSRMYWNYRVDQGETLESLARKFYKTKNGVKRIIDLNPHMVLKPGERIRIELE